MRRLEKVDLKKIHSQAKVLGTIVTVGGAMMMIMVNGPTINFPWTKESVPGHTDEAAKTNPHQFLLGSLMITAGCLSWSCFVIVQVRYAVPVYIITIINHVSIFYLLLFLIIIIDLF